jgi:hypothetical protein
MTILNTMRRELLDAMYVELLKDIGDEFPSFKIVPKTGSSLMKVCDFLLRVITLNRMTVFMTKMNTTIGNTVYVTESWERREPIGKMITLRHERVHMRQRRRYGIVIFGFLYFLALPTIFAFYRRRLEQEAYEETMRANVSFYGPRRLDEIREGIIEHFMSATYFWMWPWRSSIEAWYDELASRLRAAHVRE